MYIMAFGRLEAGHQTQPSRALPQCPPSSSQALPPHCHPSPLVLSVRSPSIDFSLEVRVHMSADAWTELSCVRLWETFQIQASGAETTVWVRCAKVPHSTPKQELSGKSLE